MYSFWFGFVKEAKLVQRHPQNAWVSLMFRMYVTTKSIEVYCHKYLFTYGVKTQVCLPRIFVSVAIHTKTFFLWLTFLHFFLSV